MNQENTMSNITKEEHAHMITDTGLTIAETVARLYNASKVQGMGFLQAKAGVMTEAEAATEIECHTRKVHWTDEGFYEEGVDEVYFDYLHGKIMKVRFTGDSSDFDPRWYDRDNGNGAALRAVKG